MGMLLIYLFVSIVVFILPAIAGADDESLRNLRKQIRELTEGSSAKAARLKEEIDYADAKLGLATETKDIIDLQKEIEDKLLQIRKVEIADRKEALRLQRETTDLSEEELRIKRQSIATDEKLLEIEEKRLNSAREHAKSVADTFSGLLGITKKWNKSLIGGFVDAAVGMGDFGEHLSKVGQQLSEQITTASVASSILTKLGEATKLNVFELDASVSSFFRATGASEGYNRMITESFQNNRQFGVSAGEAGAALGSLYTNVLRFTTFSRTTQRELQNTVSLMAEFGISSDVSAGAIDTLTKSMGYTGAEAVRLSRELVDTAVNLGLPPAMLMQELSRTAPRLAHWGKQTMDVFKGLAGAAKATGVAIGDLLDITAQYDTFEGAAEAAGRLNAVLGGPYLNSIELLSANEEERVRMLIETINLTGRSWEELGRFEKRAVASAAGISDMEQAAGIFNMTLAEYNQQLARASGEEADLADMANRAQTVMEEFRNTLNSFAVVLTPLVGLLKSTVDVIQGFTSGLSKLIGENAASWVVGITVALAYLVPKIYFAITPIRIMQAQLAALNTTMAGTAASSASAAAGFASFGSRAMAFLGPLGLVAGLATMLYAAFAGSSPSMAKFVSDAERELRGVSSVNLRPVVQSAILPARTGVTNTSNAIENIHTAIQGNNAAILRLANRPIQAKFEISDHKWTQMVNTGNENIFGSATTSGVADFA